MVQYVTVSLETPEYDLTILRIRFGRLTLKIHTKGERVPRIEAMAHNARDLGCRLGASYFPEAVGALRRMVDRFVEVLDCLDTTFIDAGLLDRLPRPGRLGAVRVGGIDIDRPRARAVLEALLALSPNPAGFTSSELATMVARLLDDERYSPSRAAYDLRKFRCKGLAARIPRSRRYLADPSALRAMAALLLLRDKVVRPLLAAASTSRRAPGPPITSAPGPTLRRCSSRDAKPLRHRWDRRLSRILNISRWLARKRPSVDRAVRPHLENL